MASYCPQALCCPRPCGHMRYPLASTSCPPLVGSDVPVSGLACAQLSGACVSWGLGDLGAAGSPGSSSSTVSRVPAGSAIGAMALATGTTGRWGVRVSVPLPHVS